MTGLSVQNKELIIQLDKSLANNVWITQGIVNSGFKKINEEKYSYENFNNKVISKIIDFFKDYEEEINLDSECKKIHHEIVQNQHDLQNLLKEAQKIKEIPENQLERIHIPGFLVEDKLKPYQIRSILHSSTLGNSANFSIPGSGKTWMAYATYFLLKNNEPDTNVEKLLVISPVSAFATWNTEYKIITNEEPNSIRIAGSNRQIIFDDAHKYDIFLISYAMVSREIDNLIELLKKYRVMIILDESHHIKNPFSITENAIRQLSPFAYKKMILTGTMMPNSFEDLWPQFNFLYPNGEILGSYAGYKFRLTDPNQNEWINQTLYPVYTRVSQKTLNLPKAQPPVIIKIPMSPIQRRIYSTIAAKIIKDDSQFKDDVFSLRKFRNNSMVYLLEAATDPSLLKEQSQFLEPPLDIEDIPLDELLKQYQLRETSGKIAALNTLVDTAMRNNEKIIIWCNFIGTIKKVAQQFSRYKPLQIYGEIPKTDDDDPTHNREKYIEEFKTKDDRNILIANPASLSESVSLHKVCHHAIYVDRTYNAAHWIQSKARIHRIGVPEDVKTRYTILSSESSIDERIEDRLQTKETRMNRFLGEDDLSVMNIDLDYTRMTAEDELDEDYANLIDHLRETANDNTP